MAETIVKDLTPMEFFREQVEKAMEHQRVSTSTFTEYYLVRLLSECVRSDRFPVAEPGFDEQPLALIYVRAVRAARSDRLKLLRALGDKALFVSGFFADSLSRGLSDLSYYRSLGGYAYARLSQEPEAESFGPGVFGELAERFGAFADVLSEVSETSRLNGPQSVLQLYERWLQTGSRRAASLLAEQGISPLAAPPPGGLPQ